MTKGNAFGPRFRASHRAAARLALTASIAIAVAGCTNEVVDQPASPRGNMATIAVTSMGGVQKFCDQGRAVYLYKQGYAGGIAVIPSAPECSATTPNAGER